MQHLNEGLPIEQLFGVAEVKAALESMSDENEAMISDDIVYKV